MTYRLGKNQQEVLDATKRALVAFERGELSVAFITAFSVRRFMTMRLPQTQVRELLLRLAAMGLLEFTSTAAAITVTEQGAAIPIAWVKDAQAAYAIAQIEYAAATSRTGDICERFVARVRHEPASEPETLVTMVEAAHRNMRTAVDKLRAAETRWQQALHVYGRFADRPIVPEVAA